MTRTIAVVFPEWMRAHGDEGIHRCMQSFEEVVRRMTEVSALIEVERPGTMFMAARGPSRYFGGEEAVARRLWSLATVDDGPLGLGIADTRFAAVAAAGASARSRTPCIIAPESTRAFLDSLALSMLVEAGTASSETVDLLSRLGMHRCGDVRAIGEVSLIERFGMEGRVIFDVVSGREVHLFAGAAGEADLSRAVDFDVPLASHPDVVSCTRECAATMLEGVASTGRRCVRLLVECDTESGRTDSRIWGEQRGFTLGTLLDRLSCHLEGWMPGEVEDGFVDGVTRVRLTPLECREVAATQALLWGGHEENAERMARAVGMIAAAGDAVSIVVPRWQGGRDVNEAYAWVPVHTVDLADAAAAARRVGRDATSVRDWRGSLPPPWPAWVDRDASEVSVLDAEGDHVGVTGRHEFTSTPASMAVGTVHLTVEKVAGPWPVEERWWDPRRARRRVRAQMLVRTSRGSCKVVVVSLENNVWKLMARYD